MRLLVVGRLSGQLSNAVKLAMAAGAKVAHVETCEAATYALRAGQGADLLMVDYELDIAGLIAANEAERIRVPVVACGVGADFEARGRRHPRRRQGVHPAAAGRRPDRRGAGRGRRRQPADDCARPGHAGGHRARRPDRRLRGLDPDHRRERRRQGGDGQARARQVAPRPAAVHLGQLRRHPGEPAGERAVRPREGRLHRRGGPAHRQVRGSQRRHAAAGRNLRDGRPPAGQAAARAAGARDRPGRRRQAGEGRHPRHRHLQPRPGPGGARRDLSARTCSTASTS